MQINRHNYEEFFLLYIDNELSAAERNAVEVFVKDNPDLNGELLMLQQTVIKADDISLEKKDWLFMEEGISSMQENILLYADDELSAPDKKAIEALLATDKTAAAEWNILRQTKLQPDTSVVFDDKQSLYRTEGSRVVVFKWWRAAAAAVLLGIVLWTGVTVYNNNLKTIPGSEGVAQDNNTGKEQPQNEVLANTNSAKSLPAETVAPENTTVAVIENNTTGKTDGNNVRPAEKNRKENNPEQTGNIAVREKNEKPSNNLPRPYFENINNRESNEIARTTVLPENDNSGTKTIIEKTNPNEKYTDPGDPATIAAIPVVNKTTDENNRYLDIDESKGKRTMLGGIIRKAKRVIERTTNIKTGDGLKVAGFEIALK